MKMLIRGIPNFVFTQILEVSDPLELLEQHELRVTHRVFGFDGNYFALKGQPGGGQRVSLYIEGVEENRWGLEKLCFDPKPPAMNTCCIRLNEQEQVRTGGTSSRLELGAGYWYMVESKFDPRYPQLLSEAQARLKEEARLQRIQNEKDEELREQILDLSSDLGYEEALRRLKGGKT
jgi:hypothetical protein